MSFIDYRGKTPKNFSGIQDSARAIFTHGIPENNVSKLRTFQKMGLKKPCELQFFAGKFENKPKTARDRLIFESHVRFVRGEEVVPETEKHDISRVSKSVCVLALYSMNLTTLAIGRLTGPADGRAGCPIGTTAMNSPCGSPRNRRTSSLIM